MKIIGTENELRNFQELSKKGHIGSFIDNKGKLPTDDFDFIEFMGDKVGFEKEEGPGEVDTELIKIKQKLVYLLDENYELKNNLNHFCHKQTHINTQRRFDIDILQRSVRDNYEDLWDKFKMLLIAIPLIWTALTVISSLLG